MKMDERLAHLEHLQRCQFAWHMFLSPYVVIGSSPHFNIHICLINLAIKF